MRVLYACTVALASALLFSVEPMVTRELLPSLGGSSVVWLSALAFFQVTLLLGYAYSVPVARASRSTPWLWLGHIALVAAAALTLWHPIQIAPLSAAGSPQWHTFKLLLASVGLPFFALSTSAPLLQAWYARSERTAVPYRMFGLSNLLSLLALAAYPFLIEPRFALDVQRHAWRVAFLLYAVAATTLALRMRSTALEEEDAFRREAEETPARKVVWLWFALPAVASFQLAAVTAHLTQDIASMPLLWVVPLLAYLLSFVLAFELPRLYHRGLVVRMMAVLLFALGYFLLQTGFNVPISISVACFTSELFFAAWFCHAELHALRPRTVRQSTRFYLLLAGGGAAGTVCAVVLSPFLTTSNYDLPFSFVLTALLVLVVEWRASVAPKLLWGTATVLGLYLLFSLHAAYEQDALFRGRNFYGTLRVTQTQTPPQAFLSRTLYNGAIQHGMEWFSDAYRNRPLTYYTLESGVGLAMEHCCAAGQPRRIGVIGLGAGTLAAYGHPGDLVRFYEINPLVIDVAQHLFTYTRNTPAKVEVVPGDARLSLAAEMPQHFDVLIVDAFTGDSIPTHLLTREAMALYRRHLRPGGVLAFHISNQYLELAPVIARLAEDSTAEAAQPFFARKIDSGPHERQGEARASWVLLSRDAGFFVQPALAAAQPVHTRANVPLWTDQYSSLLPILHWRGAP